MKRFPLALLAGLSLVVLACDDGAGPGDGACDGVTPLTIDAAGTPPGISWTPDCGVAEVEVIRLDNDGDGPDFNETVWRVQAPTNSITPAVQYGTAPTSATELVPEKLLIPGQQYRVAIRVYDPANGVFFLQASATFTRP